MARFEVLIKASAVKELEAISRKKDRQRIIKRIRGLADDPRPPGCQKLSGHGRYRIRQGMYRIVYSIEAERLVVYVVKVGIVKTSIVGLSNKSLKPTRFARGLALVR